MSGFVSQFLRTIHRNIRLWVRVVRLIFAGQIDRRAVVLQMHLLGTCSLPFVMITMGFIGMIMVLQGGYQAERLIGDFSLVGPAFLQLLVREFAPTIGALLIATRVGAGIAAELGSMTVTEQIDALRLSGAEPVRELVVPRFVACQLMVPALIVLAALSSEAAGLLTARAAFAVPYSAFFNLRLVATGDLIVGVVKAVLFGALIPVISSRAGLSARGGSEGVGAATTDAVIHSSLAIIYFDFVVNVLLYPLYER